MEALIILATGFVGFIVGLCVGKVKSVDSFREAMWEVDQFKKQEAEFKLFRLESQLSSRGTCYPDFACTARHALQLESSYRKGFYDGNKECLEAAIRFRTPDETKEMFNKLSSAMKPLEKLKNELST